MTDPRPPGCTCPTWWDCFTRGCQQQARERYAGAMVDRDRQREPRPNHDQDRAGRPLRQGT